MMAGRLLGLGVGPGDRVGLHLENTLGYAPIVVAIAAIGAVASPISVP